MSGVLGRGVHLPGRALPAAIRLAIHVTYPQTPAARTSELEKRMDLLEFLASMALLMFVTSGGLVIVLCALVVLVVAVGVLIVWAYRRRS